LRLQNEEVTLFAAKVVSWDQNVKCFGKQYVCSVKYGRTLHSVIK